MSDERLVLQFEGAEEPYELPRAGTVVIGSSAERADLVLAGEGVDASHCAIGRVREGGWAIKDLGSRAGTRVDGRPARTARLRHGTLVALGSRMLRVVDPERAKAEARERAREQRDGERVPLPERIGGYRIERVLGRGSMGAVYLAQQESLGRSVALKVLPPRLAADRDFVERFREEARAAAALNHPNVVHVYDVGEAGGVHFLSMEYMDRGSLEEEIARRGPLSWRVALRVLRDAANGLCYAEERGIVHRDVKPANLMFNSSGTTKLCDLGLATSTSSELDAGRRVFGTPHFIAPEQARAETVDHRSDLYALGATAYRLLSGHTPFEGETTREILRGHFQDEPPPLRERAPETPEALCAIVARLLEKEPADRPQSARAVVTALDALLAGEPAPAPGAGRSRAPWIAAAAGLLLVAGGGASAWILLAPPAAEPAEDAGGVAATADHEPAPPALEPEATPDEHPAAAEEDAALRALEAEARAELARARATEARDARIAALNDFVQRYRGTSASAEASEEISSLAAEIAAEADGIARIHELRADEVAKLRARIDQDAAPRPDEELRALAEHVPSAELAHDTGFAEARRQVQADVLRRALEHVRSAIERGEAAAAKGRFDDALAAWEAARPATELGERPLETLPPVAIELDTARRALEARIAGVPEARVAWAREQERLDREMLAARLADSLARDLRELDLGAARARVGGLLGEARTAETLERLTVLAEELERADGVLAALASEFERGRWLRTNVVDPRGRHSVPREIVGADERGVRVATESGEDLVPWSAFLDDPGFVDQIFQRRLTREYTREEKVGIAALARIVSGLHVARSLRAALAGEPDARFDRARVAALLEPARDWSIDAGDAALFEREERAALAVADALADARAGRWSAAIAGIEDVLAQHSTSLAVTLARDETRWREPAPAVAAAAEDAEGGE